MGPADSPRMSRVLGYSGFASYRCPGCRVRDFHPLRLDGPVHSTNLYRIISLATLLPRCCLNNTGLGCSAFARHYLRNHYYFIFLRILRCFSSPGTPAIYGMSGVDLTGCPIRKSRDLGIFAPTPGLSQLITSFFASESHRHPPYALVCFFPFSLPPVDESTKEGVPCSVIY